MTGEGNVDGELVVALRSRGLRVTPQRLALHRELRRAQRHLSAEDVLASVSRQLPGVSLPTVYATLDLFEELGFVRRVPVDSGPLLYDSRTDLHHHFRCRSCGRLVDLEANVDILPAVRAAQGRGLRPEGTQVLVTGVCSRCAG